MVGTGRGAIDYGRSTYGEEHPLLSRLAVLTQQKIQDTLRATLMPNADSCHESHWRQSESRPPKQMKTLRWARLLKRDNFSLIVRTGRDTKLCS